MFVIFHHFFSIFFPYTQFFFLKLFNHFLVFFDASSIYVAIKSCVTLMSYFFFLCLFSHQIFTFQLIIFSGFFFLTSFACFVLCVLFLLLCVICDIIFGWFFLFFFADDPQQCVYFHFGWKCFFLFHIFNDKV